MLHDPPVLRRLFLALRPPLPLARRMVAAAGWFGDLGRGLAAERLHVTMFILDDAVEASPATTAAMRALAASLGVGPVEVALDTASGTSRSIALRPSHRSPDLSRLRKRLVERATALGLAERQGYGFAPHLTLGYRAGAPFTEQVAPVGWIADEIVLIDSHVGRTRHEVLGRWPLVADEEAQLSLF